MGMFARRLVTMLIIVAAGWAIGALVGAHDLHDSRVYLVTATALLAIGLFGSTYGIDVEFVRADARLVLNAVTVGVLVKAALISLVMFAVLRDPAAIVLGVAVAQIDPLSVAAAQRHARLSPRAKAILGAWSSLDDPVTAVLAVSLASVAVALGARGAATENPAVLDGAATIGAGLLGNALLLAALAAVWFWLVRPLSRPGPDAGGWTVRAATRRHAARVLAVVVLVVAAAAAVHWVLLIGLAVAGLFYRPALDAVLPWLITAAFLVALVMLGLVLVDGVQWWRGVLLGAAAFAAQFIVGGLLTRRLPAGDRLRLALSQQNGLTAVVVALQLETMLPGMVAVVAPAVLTVNVIHLVANRALESRAVARMAARPALPPSDIRPETRSAPHGARRLPATRTGETST